jgi:putative endonuclease
MQFYIYILTNKNKTTLYIGSTNDLERRVSEHRNNANPRSFSSRYNLHFLVYFEEHSTHEEVIKREYQLKRWRRNWKEKLINSQNPNWIDLAAEWK